LKCDIPFASVLLTGTEHDARYRLTHGSRCVGRQFRTHATETEREVLPL
jgi:hypothetical protein